MMSNVLYSIVALTVVNLQGSSACLSTFKNAQNITNVQADCAKSAGLGTLPTSDQLGMDNFNDKCFSKCVLSGLQLIDNEGQIDKDALLDFMEVNAADAFLLKISELATSCTESSGADKIQGGSKTGKTAGECSPIQHFLGCFSSGAEKFC